MFPSYFPYCMDSPPGAPPKLSSHSIFLIVSHCMGGVKYRMQVMDDGLPFISYCHRHSYIFVENHYLG